MAMQTCTACGRPARKTKIALVPSHGGGTGRARVCLDCFGRAVTIVPLVAGRCACGAVATSCVGCVRKNEARDAGDVVKAAAKKLRQIAAGYRAAKARAGDSVDTNYAEGRAAGLDQAADVLDAGDF